MTDAPAHSGAALEIAAGVPAARLAAEVAESEYLRLLGYPPDHVPGEQVRTLAAAARCWYGANGRPWMYVHEAGFTPGRDTLCLGVRELRSPRLQAYLQRFEAARVLLVAVSAGVECEDHARLRWQQGRPDEYFFLEVFGSAAVEHLLAAAHHRICGEAERAGLVAVPPFSPGYAGWDVSEQNALYELLAGGDGLPGPLAVLSSGMLNPKKSQLAVMALAPRTESRVAIPGQIPCARCGWRDCAYRRRAYAPVAALGATTPRDEAEGGHSRYTVNPRALEKWAAERLAGTPGPDGTLEMVFRFDGTTCSNQGQPLAYEYRATFRPTAGEHVLLGAECRPIGGGEGHRFMCSYLADSEQLERAIAAESPSPGRTLSDLIAAPPNHAVSGCLCTPEHRAHKWRLALEAMHFALAAPAAGAPFLNQRSHDQAL